MKAVLSHVDWASVIGALVVTQAATVGQGLTLWGGVATFIPFDVLMRTAVAMAFAELIGGPVSSTAASVSLHRQHGFAPGIAYSSGLLSSVAGVAVPILLGIGFLPVAAGELHLSAVGPAGSNTVLLQVLLLLVAATGLAGGLAFMIPRGAPCLGVAGPAPVRHRLGQRLRRHGARRSGRSAPRRPGPHAGRSGGRPRLVPACGRRGRQLQCADARVLRGERARPDHAGARRLGRGGGHVHLGAHPRRCTPGPRGRRDIAVPSLHDVRARAVGLACVRVAQRGRRVLQLVHGPAGGGGSPITTTTTPGPRALPPTGCLRSPQQRVPNGPGLTRVAY